MRISKQPAPMQTRKADSYIRPQNNSSNKNQEVSATVLRQRSSNIAPTIRRQANTQNTPANKQPAPRKGLSAFRSTKSLSLNPSNPSSSKPVSPPAPSSQFKRYLSDTENIFYEDSYNMRALRFIKSAKLYLSCLLLIMVASYVLIGRIVPFPREKCPKNAVCNVFVHCHEGYVLRDGRCQIDPDIIDKANSISTAVISQLSYNYGDSDCLSQSERQPYSANIQDVLREFNVQGDILRQELLHFFLNKSNQAEHSFSYRLNQITAQKKQYSLTCATTLFILSSEFKYYLFTVVLIVFGCVKLMNRWVEWSKARKIYTFLKRKTLISDELCISMAKREGESLYGSWNTEIWTKVDELRYQDGCISYYVDQEELYWKRVD